MSALSINPPYPVFPDIDGQPLEDGYIYIGTAGLNPIANPIAVYWDAALTIPAALPVRTIGGFPARAGSPAMLYVNSDYSIQVQNKNGSVTYSAPNATERYSNVVITVDASQVLYDPAGLGAVQTTVQAKLRQTVSPQDFGAVGDGVTDDTAEIQAFFNYISANRVDSAECNGNFAISSGVTLGPSSGTIATKLISGAARFTALNAIDTLLTIINCGVADTSLVWDGQIELQGTGGASYASRTCRRGVYISNTARARFGGFRARYFSQLGVDIDDVLGTSTETDLGFVRGINCGSGQTSGSLTANWSNPSNSGSSGSSAQRTIIDVDVLPPTTNSTPVVVLLSGKTYYVYNIDTVNSQITVFPWVDNTLTSGSLTYIFGGAASLKGNDTGIIKINGLDALTCGTGLCISSLYGPIVNAMVAQSCGAGLVVGANPAAAMDSATIDGLYSEGNSIDILRVSRAARNVNIFTSYVTALSKFQETDAARLSTNELNLSTSGSLYRFSYQNDGQLFEFEKEVNNIAPSTLSFDVNKPFTNLIYKRNSATINLVAFDVDINKAFGYNSGALTYIGTGAGDAPTGTFTFVAPSGTTVNGGATAAFSTFSAPVTFNVFYDIAATNFIVWQP